MPAQLVPVMWRLHAWWLSGVGISSSQAAHYAKRTAALARYDAHFGQVLRLAKYADVPDIVAWQRLWGPLQWLLRHFGSVNYPARVT